MGPFLYDTKSINNKLWCLERKICELEQGGSGSGSSATFPRVANYSALPAAALHINEYYHVLASQGTRWIPGWLGGADYFGKGIYFSNGASWDFVGAVPYQVTQAEADAGIVNDGFMTPLTTANTTTVSHPGHLHSATEIGDGSVNNTEYSYLNSVTSNIQTQINDIQDDIVALAIAL